MVADLKIKEHSGNLKGQEEPQELTPAARAILKDRYMLKGESSPLEVFLRAARAYSDDEAHRDRLLTYMKSGWFMSATPILANSGTKRGLPISCFLNVVDDSREGLGAHFSENLMLSTSGGGIGSDWSYVRSVGTSTSTGNVTTGIIPFIKTVDSLTVASSQGSTRRGATAVSLRVDHPEIEEFIEIRKVTGDHNRRSLNLHNSVAITDDFMRHVESGEAFNLVDPHTHQVIKSLDPRVLWMKILKTRMETGEPYLFFIDRANEALPEHLKKLGLKINTTNLCTEVMLPTSSDRTAVCCLSSVNLEHYDLWSKDENFIEDILRFLDNALDHFIWNCGPSLEKASNSARRERSVGLGVMGFHTLLQSKGIPFEGAVASGLNRKVFKHLKEKTKEANLKLGLERGEAPDAKGTGLRFSHCMALAPTANISVFVPGGTSPCVEPWTSNAFTHKTSSGVHLTKNKTLDKVLREVYLKGGSELKNIWTSIILNEGSVRHLDFLSKLHLEVFKTAFELDQSWIIDHAASRQPFIDQGQSINLFLSNGIDEGSLHSLHKRAWSSGLKSLYYLRSKSIGKAETISYETKGECTSCQ